MKSRSPVDLECQHAHEPWGIDQTGLAFSWENPGFSGPQTHYQLLIEDGQGKRVYDSFFQTSSFPLHHCSSTSFLSSYSRYSWKVAVRTGYDSWSEFSAAAGFQTSDLEHALRPAQWITDSQAAAYQASSWESGKPGEKTSQLKAVHYHGIYLAKRFTLQGQKREIVSATCYVTAGGLYTLKLNGRRAGRHLLTPDVSDFTRRVYYDCIDITGLLEKENEILISLGNGRHIALYGFQRPRAICLIRIRYTDGSIQTFCTDDSWLSGSGPVKQNSIFDGEVYDARSPVLLERRAQIVSGYRLESRISPPISLEERISPVSITARGESFIIDFGQNFSGFVELSGHQKAGTTVTLAHAELLDASGRLNSSSLRAAKAVDSYTFKGESTERWHPEFTYHGFRYAELSGWEGELLCENLSGWFIHTETEQRGSFSCGHEGLMRLHKAILYGTRSNMMGIPTDSPQRDERHGWLGDALLACEEALLNYYPYRFYEKFLQDIADTQKEDGSVSDVAPNFWMEKPADPAWGSAFISIGYLLYLSSGDTALLRRYLPWYEDYIAFQSSHAVEGILKGLGTFGDWCAPGLVTSKKTGLECISSWYYLHDIMLLERICRALGEREKTQTYSRLAKQVREQFLAEYYRDGIIVSQPMTPWDFPDTTSQLLALSSRLLPPAEHSLLATSLSSLVTIADGEHVGTGIHGTAYLLPVLSQEGFEQKAYRIATQRSYPGWLYMIENGATTLWERWELIECEGMNSHNHIMLGSIDSWFYQYLAGMTALEPGWQTIGFYPGYFPELPWAEGEVSTPYGRARVHWELLDSSLTVELQVPSGTTGVLHLPKWVSPSSLEGLYSTAVDCDSFRVSSQERAYRLPPGIHRFACQVLKS